MKIPFPVFVATLLAPVVKSQSPNGPGSGPYPAEYTTDPTLPTHTIYKPITPPPTLPLPILIWGNGACTNNGTRFSNLLTHIASHGFIALASGPPNGCGTTDAQLMRDAIDWITQQAGEEGSGYETADLSKLAVAGQSCGGLEAYELRDDERVKGLGIFNSGFFDFRFPVPGWEGPETIGEVRKPVFWFLGGEGDIAYENGMRDYAGLQGQPKWVGNYPVGHLGTYAAPDAGEFGVAAVNWVQFLLRGDEEAAAWFLDGGAEAAGWEETAREGLQNL
ncbi:Alpha/Beta hydrolase protein [Aspergillus crustosus]